MKQLPIIIHSCLECPYFVEGEWSFGHHKSGDKCNYGRKFIHTGGVYIAKDCPLEDWNYGDPIKIQVERINEKEITDDNN